MCTRSSIRLMKCESSFQAEEQLLTVFTFMMPGEKAGDTQSMTFK